jgi:2-C-methyl-D-erythritol 4-phosphate cytidylyltransferase
MVLLFFPLFSKISPCHAISQSFPLPAADRASVRGSRNSISACSVVRLLHHTLAALVACPEIDRVWVVLSPEDGEWDGYDWSGLGPSWKPCAAAARRGPIASATACGRRPWWRADDDWILVHDAARPCLSRAMLAALLGELADDQVGGILAVPVADTLKRADGEWRVAATEPRDGLWQAQTPQMFRYGLLKEALEKCRAVTDESGAIEALGLRPRLVRADATNLKVTYPADLVLAALILRGRK